MHRARLAAGSEALVAGHGTHPALKLVSQHVPAQRLDREQAGAQCTAAKCGLPQRRSPRPTLLAAVTHMLHIRSGDVESGSAVRCGSGAVRKPSAPAGPAAAAAAAASCGGGPPTCHRKRLLACPLCWVRCLKLRQGGCEGRGSLCWGLGCGRAAGSGRGGATAQPKQSEVLTDLPGLTTCPEELAGVPLLRMGESHWAGRRQKAGAQRRWHVRTLKLSITPAACAAASLPRQSALPFPPERTILRVGVFK